MAYLVKNIKVDVNDEEIGMCGPMGGSVVVSVQYQKDKEDPKWLHCVEVDGIPSFYQGAEDIHDALLKNDSEEEGFWEKLNEENYIGEFDGLPLGEYDRIFEGFDKSPSNPSIPLLRLVIYLVRCPMGEVQDLIAKALNKEVEVIGIPLSDVEEDYRSAE